MEQVLRPGPREARIAGRPPRTRNQTAKARRTVAASRRERRRGKTYKRRTDNPGPCRGANSRAHALMAASARARHHPRGRRSSLARVPVAEASGPRNVGRHARPGRATSPSWETSAVSFRPASSRALIRHQALPARPRRPPARPTHAQRYALARTDPERRRRPHDETSLSQDFKT